MLLTSIGDVSDIGPAPFRASHALTVARDRRFGKARRLWTFGDFPPGRQKLRDRGECLRSDERGRAEPSPPSLRGRARLSGPRVQRARRPKQGNSTPSGSQAIRWQGPSATSGPRRIPKADSQRIHAAWIHVGHAVSLASAVRSKRTLRLTPCGRSARRVISVLVGDFKKAPPTLAET
jgi:hypothetical protein